MNLFLLCDVHRSPPGVTLKSSTMHATTRQMHLNQVAAVNASHAVASSLPLSRSMVHGLAIEEAGIDGAMAEYQPPPRATALSREWATAPSLASSSRPQAGAGAQPAHHFMPASCARAKCSAVAGRNVTAAWREWASAPSQASDVRRQAETQEARKLVHRRRETQRTKLTQEAHEGQPRFNFYERIKHTQEVSEGRPRSNSYDTAPSLEI